MAHLPLCVRPLVCLALLTPAAPATAGAAQPRPDRLLTGDGRAALQVSAAGAEGGTAAELPAGSSLRGRLGGPFTGVRVRVRPAACSPGTELGLRVGSTRFAPRALPAAAWTELVYVLPRALRSGHRPIELRTSDETSRCPSGLLVDEVTTIRRRVRTATTTTRHPDGWITRRTVAFARASDVSADPQAIETRSTMQPAETSVEPRAAGSRRPLRGARGGRALVLRGAASAATEHDAPVGRIRVRARGLSCSSARTVRIAVDGVPVGRIRVSGRRWRWHALTMRGALPSGRHVVELRTSAPAGRRTRCGRWVAIDRVETRGTIAATSAERDAKSSVSAPGASERPELRQDGPDPETETQAPDPAAPGTTVAAPASGSPAPPAPKPAAPASPGSARSGFYVDPTNKAKQRADQIRASRPDDARTLDKIGDTFGAIWLGGYSNELTRLQSTLRGARATKTRPIVVIYGVPNRDGGQYSSGGMSDSAAYARWIDTIKGTIGSEPATIIIEPDGAAMSLSEPAQSDRFRDLTYATKAFASLSGTTVYIDAGNSWWKSAATMVSRLKSSGIAYADGFALNTSNFLTTASQASYGKQISAGVGGKPFVVDTSRNGNGPLAGATGEDAWCNPRGRALGARPTTDTGDPQIAAYLWLKLPGTSDGACSGYPKAGDFIEGLALEMARNASW